LLAWLVIRPPKGKVRWQALRFWRFQSSLEEHAPGSDRPK
jgi:hypothetical protein